MGRVTGIQWTDATHNFWSGCDKVSPGCAHCYAERLMQRFGRDFGTVTKAPAGRFADPLKWERQLVARAAGAVITPLKVFTNSMSDFFHEAADEWRPEAWEIVRKTPHLTYQILTKRPERIREHLPPDWGEGYPNVWLGVSAEYQRQFDARIALLREVPAAVRFVSYEPALGPLTLEGYWGSVDWVIAGGESGGREARPLDLRWVRALIDECHYGAAIHVFVKQLGSVWARQHGAKDWHGGDWLEWPEEYRVRDFPEPRPVAAPVEYRQAVLV